MKKRRLLSILAGILTYTAGALLLSGYGNYQNHKTINSWIVDAFKTKYFATLSGKFTNYLFDDMELVKLSGDAITKGALLPPDMQEGYITAAFSNYISYIETGTVSYSPTEWIIHGGFSADEPEALAALRHFYDPTKPAGSRYLSDMAQGALMPIAQGLLNNPSIDAVDWAIGTAGQLGTDEHNYTWENGKKWVQAALESSDKQKRDEFMAKAWRALGETLHMIADNGCPPHVRDDSHPAPLGMSKLLGNPDPYEELMVELEAKSSGEFDGLKSGAAPADLKTSLSGAKKVRDIAHGLAVFTNASFFSNETISGTDWKGNSVSPITHPSNVYPSPKLSTDAYDNYYYTLNVGGASVKACTDLWYFASAVPYRSYPHIDMECVKSQAAVLIPSIREAGVNAMKMFIPALKVEITDFSAADGTIKGTVTHTTDDEYQTKIMYNGPVDIYISSQKAPVTADCSNGKFETTAENVKAQDTAYAKISCAGFAVKSESLEASQGKKNINISLFSGVPITVDVTQYGSTERITSSSYILSFNNYQNYVHTTPYAEVSWKGNQFTYKFVGNSATDEDDPLIRQTVYGGGYYQKYDVLIQGTLDSKQNLVSATFDLKLDRIKPETYDAPPASWDSQGNLYHAQFTLSDLQLSTNTDRSGTTYYHYPLLRSNAASHISGLEASWGDVYPFNNPWYELQSVDWASGSNDQVGSLEFW